MLKFCIKNAHKLLENGNSFPYMVKVASCSCIFVTIYNSH